MCVLGDSKFLGNALTAEKKRLLKYSKDGGNMDRVTGFFYRNKESKIYRPIPSTKIFNKRSLNPFLAWDDKMQEILFLPIKGHVKIEQGD